MSQPSVLVVDDDQKLVALVRGYLARDGYRVFEAFDGRAAMDVARREQPALVILDLMLPHLSGWEVCRLLRQEGDIPVILLTARTAEDDKLYGLELGADDYVTKPFSPRELVARVRTVLRRARNGAANDVPEDVVAGPVVLSHRRHEVTVDGRRVDLTPTEFRLLAALIQEPERVFTRSQLVERGFDTDFEGVDRNVDVHVVKLRRKLGWSTGGPLHTVHGVGYKLARLDLP